ncbi:MAG: right-handed parallel beta-helix repeat-containing protein [Euryarchaeota archaeon]|nr:right-handed parallel beta-helix repeat-containing protein [Euryarchaeota archaeon]
MGNAAGKCAVVIVSLLAVLSTLAIGGQDAPDDVPASALPPTVNYITHAPIRINSDAEFASMAASEGWNGSGAQGNPYIIENYDINGTGYSYCIYVGNTTVYYVIRNCNLHHANGIDVWPYFYNSGLMINNGTNAIVEITNASYNNLVGLYTSYSSNISFNNCSAWSNDYGICAELSSDVTFTNNTASSNYYGLLFSSSNRCTMTMNYGSSNAGMVDSYGICIFLGSNNTLIGNTADANLGNGIWIYSSSDNQIINDTISNNQGGIYLFSSNRTVLVNNTVSTNNYGISVSVSNNNTIYHNNIINNTNQSFDDRNDNWWNAPYPTCGNYWSNYTGIDVMSGPGQNISGADGIGDTPFIIDADSRDNYPLMAPFTGALPTSVWLNMTVHIGWNLISTPLDGPSKLPGVLLDRTDGGIGYVQWDRVMWWDATDPTNHWKQYYTGWNSTLNDLTDINNTMGFWLNITSLGDGLLCLGGPEYSYPTATLIPLYPGWNMIGFPSSSTTYTVGQFMADTGATRVEGESGVLSPAYIMKAGEGYWAYLVTPTNWFVVY